MTEERLTFPVFLSYLSQLAFPSLLCPSAFHFLSLSLHLQFSFLSSLVPSFSRNTSFFPFLPTHLTSFLFIFSFTSLSVIFNFLFCSYKSLPFFSCYTSIPFLSSSHISLLFLTCPSHTSLSFFASSFLFFLSYLPFFPFISTHLTSLPLSSYFHISLPFLDQQFFCHFFLLPSSHFLFFIPLISLSSFFLSSLPISTHLFSLPVLHILPFLTFSLPLIHPNLTYSFL